ncbi:MAG: response regulator [Candidatus Omnitrophota bacterium]
MSKRKVLVVDDESNFLKLVKMNLENTEKYEVTVLQDPTGIMPLVKSFKPDLILLDILMPKMDGTEVCKALNEDPYGKRTPIIVLSALDTVKDKLIMYKLGVVDFLAKPIDAKDLIAKIEKALEYK